MRWPFALFLLLGLSCLQASAATYALPQGKDNMVGAIHYITTQQEDTLVDIARDQDVGYDALKSANPGIDPWLPKVGASVLIPSEYILPAAPRRGIVINLPAMRLFYYPADRAVVETFPIGIGREGWSTPLGKTKIVSKVRNPTWTPPASIRAEHAENGDPLPAVVAAGPDNPLGLYALKFAWAGYLIHDTNKPYGVGMRVSHGCIRLFPKDIESLFQQVPVGTPVEVVDQPWLWGEREGEYYLQVFPPLHAPQSSSEEEAAFRQWLQAKIPAGYEISWTEALRILRQADGVPTLVVLRAQSTGSLL